MMKILVLLCLVIDPTQVSALGWLPRNRTRVRKSKEQSSGIPSLRGGVEGHVWDTFFQPGSLSVPFNGVSLKNLYQGIVGPLLSLSLGSYMLSSWENLKNVMIFWSSLVYPTIIAKDLVARNTAILHTYEPSLKNATENDPLFCGLNVPRQNFLAWVGYHLGDVGYVQGDAVKTRLHFIYNRNLWGKKLQDTWREGRLLKSPLSFARSRKDYICDLYTRILKDELEDDRDHSSLVAFLQTEFGRNITRLQATNFNKESNDTQLEVSCAAGENHADSTATNHYFTTAIQRLCKIF